MGKSVISDSCTSKTKIWKCKHFIVCIFKITLNILHAYLKKLWIFWMLIYTNDFFCFTMLIMSNLHITTKKWWKWTHGKVYHLCSRYEQKYTTSVVGVTRPKSHKVPGDLFLIPLSVFSRISQRLLKVSNFSGVPKYS